MNFQFDSLLGLLFMDGHGVFVWASFFVTVIALTVLAFIPFYQKKYLTRQLLKQQRIKKTVSQTMSKDQH